MRTPLLTAVVIIMLAACAQQAAPRAHERPKLPAVAWDDGAPRALPPARPDSTAIISTSVHIVTGPAAALAAAGLPTAGDAVVLPAAVRDEAIVAAADAPILHWQLDGLSGQRHSACEQNQFAYVADYRLIDGLPKPEVEVAAVGTTAEIMCRVVDGRLLVDEAEVTTVAMPSTARCSAVVPGFGPIAWEEPYLVTARTVAVPAGFVVAPHARLALPMRYRATRACAQVRTLLPAGTRVDDASATGGLEQGVSVAVLSFDWSYSPEPERVLFDDPAPATSVRLQRRVDAGVSSALEAVVAALAKAADLPIALDAALPAAERAAPASIGAGETVLAALTRLATEDDLFVEITRDHVALSLPGHGFPAPRLGLTASRAPTAAEMRMWNVGESALHPGP